MRPPGTLSCSHRWLSDHPACRAGSSASGAIPSPQSHLGVHMRLALLCPLKGLLRLPPTSSQLRFSDFMGWESTEIQECHRGRKTWPGKVTLPSSQHHPAPLGLRSDTRQRFLLPAGLACGHGDTLHSTDLGSGWQGRPCWQSQPQVLICGCRDTQQRCPRDP